MAMLLIYSSVYLFFITTDLVPLFLDKRHKEFWINLSFLTLAYGISILLALDILQFSPAFPIKKLIEGITGK